MKLGVTPAGGAKAGKWVRRSIFIEEERCFSFSQRAEDLEMRSDSAELESGNIYPFLYPGAFRDSDIP